MRLTVFNGSPRGKSGNTEILAGWFAEGTRCVEWNTYTIDHLRNVGHHEQLVDKFRDSEVVLLAFPLYTDGMPGIVKAFMERLEPLAGRAGNPPIMYLVQSGFPEAIQSQIMERYLPKLSRRLGCRHIGTMVRGGCEGVHLMPPPMTRSIRKTLGALGEKFARTAALDAALLKRFRGTERLSALGAGLFRLASIAGLANFYWDSNLRKHGAMARSWARPYEGQW